MSGPCTDLTYTGRVSSGSETVEERIVSKCGPSGQRHTKTIVKGTGSKPFTIAQNESLYHAAAVMKMLNETTTVKFAIYYVKPQEKVKKLEVVFTKSAVSEEGNGVAKFSVEKFKAGKYQFQVTWVDSRAKGEKFKSGLIDLQELVAYNARDRVYEIKNEITAADHTIKIEGVVAHNQKASARFIFTITNVEVYSEGESSDSSDESSDEEEEPSGRRPGGCHHGRMHGSCGICHSRSTSKKTTSYPSSAMYRPSTKYK